MHSLILAIAVIGQPLPSIASETADAKKDWVNLSPEEQLYTRYMSTFAMRQKGFFGPAPEKVLSFHVNALSNKAVIKPVLMITETVARIDLRDYGWRVEDWSVVTQREPYLGLKNGLIVRADWFIWHTSNTEFADSAYLLQYRGKPPKNLDEFHAFWGVNVKTIRAFDGERGAMIEKGASIVAQQNRVVAWGLGVLGTSYYSFDYKRSDAARRLTERLNKIPPPDAQEAITPTKNGLHAYLLVGANGQRVEKADDQIATDWTDSRRPVVRNIRSCVVCHGRVSGLHPPRNFINEYLDKANPVIGIDAYKKQTQQFIETFFTTDSGKRMLFDRGLYAEAVAACNGLEPEENANAYQRVLEEYEYNITQEQAARELGVSIETLKQASAQKFIDPESPQTDVALLGSDRPGTVPRESWEELTYHQFVERLNILQGRKK